MSVVSKLYTADGSTRIFSSDFSVISESHIAVYVDDVLISKSQYDTINDAAVFNVAPDNGAKIEVVVGTTPDEILTPPTDIKTVANSIDDIEVVSTNIEDVNTTADNISSVGTVAGSISNVNAVGTNITNVNTTAGSIGNVNTTAGSIGNVNAVGTNITNVNTTAGAIDNVNTVATNIADVNLAATNIADIQDIADEIQKVIAVADDLNEVVSEIEVVSDNIANVNAVGTNISNVNTVAGNTANINTVSSNTSDITTVATNIADVNAVEDNLVNINAVANNATNINIVSDNTSNINIVSTNTTNINTVSSNIADVNTVATNIADVNAVEDNLTNIEAVADNEANINAVVGNATNINTVAGINTDVTTVAGIDSDVTTVSGVSSNVTTVANDISNVNTVATNISEIQDYNDRYSVGLTEPASPTEGDLWFDTANDIMKVYDGSLWQNAGSSVNGTSERQTYTATSGQTVFNATYDAGFIDVYVNGIKLLDGTDFTATNGTTVVISQGLSTGDIVDIVAYGTFELADTYTQAQADSLLATKEPADSTILKQADIGTSVLAPNGDGSQLTGLQGVDTGFILISPTTTIPSGYLECNGSSLSTTTYSSLFSVIGYIYGGSGSSFTLPDLRGEFIRGWDNGKGTDSGRVIATSQTDALQNITGTLYGSVVGSHGGQATGAFTSQAASSSYRDSIEPYGGSQFVFDASNVARTSTETRPRNIAMMYCIKY